MPLSLRLIKVRCTFQMSTLPVTMVPPMSTPMARILSFTLTICGCIAQDLYLMAYTRVATARSKRKMSALTVVAIAARQLSGDNPAGYLYIDDAVAHTSGIGSAIGFVLGEMNLTNVVGSADKSPAFFSIGDAHGSCTNCELEAGLLQPGSSRLESRLWRQPLPPRPHQGDSY